MSESEWMNRQAATILSPEAFEKFISECKISGNGKINKSKEAQARVVEYYNNKSVQERANLMRLYNEMTEEQRKNPKKYDRE